MLGINFKGRYNRKKFWLMNLLVGLVPVILGIIGSIVISLFSHPVKINQLHYSQVNIANNVLQKKGVVNRAEVEQEEKDVLNSTSIEEKEKNQLIAAINDMKKMNDTELLELTRVEPDLYHFILFGLCTVVGIYLSLLSVSFWAKRAHDLNKSGWMALTMFIPLLNFVFLIYLGFFKGDESDNQYGPSVL